MLQSRPINSKVNLFPAVVSVRLILITYLVFMFWRTRNTRIVRYIFRATSVPSGETYLDRYNETVAYPEIR